MSRKSKELIGEMLVKAGLINAYELERALSKQSGEPIGKTLLNLGLIKEEDLISVLARQLGVKHAVIKDLQIASSLIEKVPPKVAYHYKIMPISLKNNVLTIGILDPLDIHALDDIRLLLNCEIDPVLCGEKDLNDAIRKYYGIGAETLEKIVPEVIPEGESAPKGKDVEDIENIAEDASIIKFVNQILLGGYHDRATDIHIEPYKNDLKVRYRIDGVMHDAAIPATIKHFKDAIVSRIKIMASMNIAEHRLPQDGRIRVKVGETEELDLRVSVLPTPVGEGIDIRILSTSMLYNMEALGLMPDDLSILEKVIEKPHGIMFVTGPTGSGKTTTLYSCLNKLNRKELKIITIEDPVEYQMPGITQIQVMPKIGLTFAAGLRSVLRHDPDIIMVGEVRDYETAEITIRSALTGHLVFSTLHTNDAAGGITRLLDMGIEPYLVASSVECFIAQRLVRLSCQNCKVEKPLTKEIARELGVPAEEIDSAKIYEGAGCESCKFTGYKGRSAIYEFLLVKEEIRDLILQRASSDKIKKKAVALGMRSLARDGWRRIKQGITTPSEVLRVAKETD